MADVVRIDRGDVLVISNVSHPEDSDAFEEWARAIELLKEWAGIACVIVAEDDVRLGRLSAEVAGSLTASVRDRLKRPVSDDGRG